MQLYADKKITASEAESLIAYSNNAGPLFVIGVIGNALLGSAKLGLILYILEIISAILSGIILKAYTYSSVLTEKTTIIVIFLQTQTKFAI